MSSNIKVHPKLAHLTPDQIDQLLERYYAKERIKDLIDEYHIQCAPSVLHNYFPMIIEDELCPYCSANLVTKRRSVNGYKQTPFCSSCKHEKTSFCSCSNCRLHRDQMKLREHDRKVEKIKQSYRLSDRKPVEVSELTLWDRLYLAVLLRSSFDEAFQTINPVLQKLSTLSPSDDMNLEIVNSLYKKRIILVDPSSDISAFKDDENFPQTFYVYKVRYHVNVFADGVSRHNLLQELMNPPVELFHSNPYFCYEAWRTIAVEECCQYLLYNLKKVDFDYTIGQKTIATFQELLENFSVAQVYSLVYRCVTNATRYYQEKKVSKKEAANTVIGNCLRLAERSIAENREVYNYGRIKDLPQTLVSETLYNRILLIGKKGFEQRPDLSEFVQTSLHNKYVEDDIVTSQWNPYSQAKFIVNYGDFRSGDIVEFVGKSDNEHSLVRDQHGDHYLIPHHVIQVKILINRDL